MCDIERGSRALATPELCVRICCSQLASSVQEASVGTPATTHQSTTYAKPMEHMCMNSYGV